MKKHTNKILAIVLAVTLLTLSVVAGTLAYLVKKTDPIVNTFVSGDGVNIVLKEVVDAVDVSSQGGATYTVIPGESGNKQLFVNVTGEQSCYVFIALEKSAAFDDYAEYTHNNACWVVADETATRIVYAYVGAGYNAETPAMKAMSNGDTTLVDDCGVIASDTVEFKADITNEMLGDDMPTVTLTATAYAIQSIGLGTTVPSEVWAAGQADWFPAPAEP